MIEREIEEVKDYPAEMYNDAYKYLTELKSRNRKEFNKLNKQGRKFSDNIMKRLK